MRIPYVTLTYKSFLTQFCNNSSRTKFTNNSILPVQQNACVLEIMCLRHGPLPSQGSFSWISLAEDAVGAAQSANQYSGERRKYLDLETWKLTNSEFILIIICAHSHMTFMIRYDETP